MSENLGDAFLELKTDNRGLTGGLKRGEADTKKGVGRIAQAIGKHNKAVGAAMTGLGIAIAGAAILSVKSYVTMGDEVQKMALRTGFSTEALSEWRHAVQISGSDIKSFEKGIKRMSSFILDAKDGLSTSTDALDRLGVSVQDLEGLSPEAAFELLSVAIADVPDELEKAALAQDVFGRAGTALLPLLKEGSQGIATLRAEAHDMGIVFDQEAANKAAKLADSMTRMKSTMTGVMLTIAEALVPVITVLVDKVTGVLRRVREWTEAHPKLAKIILIVVGAMGALMLVLGPLLIMLPLLAAGFALIAGASGIGTVLIAIGALVALIVILIQKKEQLQNLFSFIPGVNKAVKDVTASMKEWRDVVDSTADSLNNMNLQQLRVQAQKLKTAQFELTQAIGAGNKATAEQQRLFNDLRDRIFEVQEAIQTATAKVEESYDGIGEAARENNAVVNAEGQKMADAIQETFDRMTVREESAFAMRLSLAEAALAKRTEAEAAAAEQREQIEADHLADLTTMVQGRMDEERRLQKELLGNLADLGQQKIDHAEWVQGEIARAHQRWADDQAQQLSVVENSWARFEMNLDSTIAAMNENSLDFGDVVEGLADRFGVSTDDMADQIKGFGLKFGDTMGLIEQFSRATVDRVIAGMADIGIATKKATGAPVSREQQVSARQSGLIANREALALQRLKNVQAGVGTASIDASIASLNEKLSDVVGLVQQESQLRTVSGFQFHVGESLLNAQHGAVVPGPASQAQLAVVHGQETITPAGAGSGPTVIFQGPVYGFEDFERKVAGIAVRQQRRGALKA